MSGNFNKNQSLKDTHKKMFNRKKSSALRNTTLEEISENNNDEQLIISPNQNTYTTKNTNTANLLA